MCGSIVRGWSFSNILLTILTSPKGNVTCWECVSAGKPPPECGMKTWSTEIIQRVQCVSVLMMMMFRPLNVSDMFTSYLNEPRDRENRESNKYWLILAHNRHLAIFQTLKGKGPGRRADGPLWWWDLNADFLLLPFTELLMMMMWAVLLFGVCWIRKCNAWCGLLLVLFGEETFRTQWMRRMILECLLMHDAWNPSNPNRMRAHRANRKANRWKNAWNFHTFGYRFYMPVQWYVRTINKQLQPNANNHARWRSALV